MCNAIMREIFVVAVLGMSIIGISGCSSIDVTYTGEAESIPYRVSEAQCERVGTAVICQIVGDRRPGFPFATADAQTVVQIVLLFNDVARESAANIGPSAAYVIRGGMAPEEDDVWEITETHLSQTLEDGRWVLSGELVCGRVLSHSPRESPRTASIKIPEVEMTWSAGVAAEMHSVFLLKKIPSLSAWPRRE